MRQFSAPHPRIGVSSWSLHHSLMRGDFSLADLPQHCAQHGLGLLEICDFHIASTEKPSLDDLRARCADAGVALYTLLKDSGDITHPDPSTRAAQIDSVLNAIDTAAEIGAQRIRVIAGDAEPSEAALELSAQALRRIAAYGRERGVRVVTENWHRLLDTPEDVLHLLELTGGEVGLKLDFGNWSAPRKFHDLPLIAPKAECTHAKAHYSNSMLDAEDFMRCLDICRDAGFSGPHILIYDSGGDEWAHLDEMRGIALSYVA